MRLCVEMLISFWYSTSSWQILYQMGIPKHETCACKALSALAIRSAMWYWYIHWPKTRHLMEFHWLGIIAIWLLSVWVHFQLLNDRCRMSKYQFNKPIVSFIPVVVLLWLEYLYGVHDSAERSVKFDNDMNHPISLLLYITVTSCIICLRITKVLFCLVWKKFSAHHSVRQIIYEKADDMLKKYFIFLQFVISKYLRFWPYGYFALNIL